MEVLKCHFVIWHLNYVGTPNNNNHLQHPSTIITNKTIMQVRGLGQNQLRKPIMFKRKSMILVALMLSIFKMIGF